MKWLIIGLVILISLYTARKFWLERKKMKLEEEADQKVALPDFTEMPMLERDYLLRYFQIFAKALAEAILKRKDNQLDEALRIINDAFAEDREAQALVDLPLDEFLAQIDYKQEFDAQKWAMAAELLDEKAQILNLQKQAKLSHEVRIKAMHLVLEVLLTDPETYRPSTIDLLNTLRNSLPLTDLPDSTLALLVEYEASEN